MGDVDFAGNWELWKENTGKTAGTLNFPKPVSCRWLAKRFPSLISPGLV
jgi:hypothetical protein